MGYVFTTAAVIIEIKAVLLEFVRRHAICRIDPFTLRSNHHGLMMSSNSPFLAFASLMVSILILYGVGKDGGNGHAV